MLNNLYTLIATLSPSERRVAETILADPKRAAHEPIEALAGRAEVSAPTVLRFCRRLGVNGFRAFREHLIAELAQASREAPAWIHSTLAPLSSKDSITAVHRKIVDATISDLLALRERTDAQALERAAHWLETAERLHVYGPGGNQAVATDAQLKFTRLGKACTSYSDVFVYSVAVGLLGASDLLLALSNSGRNTDLIAAVTFAKTNGARTIAITRPDSPLGHAAHLTLAIHNEAHEPSDSFAPIRSRISPMVLIDTLAVAVALRQGSDALARLLTARTLIDGKFSPLE